MRPRLRAHQPLKLVRGDVSQFEHAAIVADETVSLESVKRMVCNNRIRCANPMVYRAFVATIMPYHIAIVIPHIYIAPI